MTTTFIPSMQNNGPRNIWDAIESDTYEARLVKCVGLGVQEQPEWQGQKKQPAFKMAMTFELIDVDATGVDKDGKPLEPRPACQFKDYFLFPGAKRGGVYDLVRAIDPSLEAVPNNLEWFEKALGSVINVEVGSYVNKSGQTRNKVVGVSPVPGRNKERVGPARCEMQFFNPYVENDTMLASYSKLFKFQRDTLMEAHDKDNMPYAGKEPIQNDERQSAPVANPYDNKVATQQTPADMAFDEDIPF